MRVRHFNCATLCPRIGGRFLSGSAHKKPVLVCHVLVIESDVGLVLVDTGFGVEDCRTPTRRLGASVAAIGPRFDERETALRQIEGLGHASKDVTQIIVTHLDLDHAGGLPDFPNAIVHVMTKEHTAAMQRATIAERSRYRPAHWRHGPRWKTHAVEGEKWNGFEAVRALEGTKDEVLLVPLEGHTSGHAGVAVKADEGWLFHCGDAYFHADEVTGGRAPSGLEFFQRMVAKDDALRKRNRSRLKELVATHADVRVFCAHSESELEALRGGT
jgi:glyoxylase-like metal-dependent hydrolase (beta-lactamase superfamily II)